MNARALLLLSGAVGLGLAALFYLLSRAVQGTLSFLLLLPQAAIVIFVVLFLVSLVEIAVMVWALQRVEPQVPFWALGLLAAAYVAFAGVYAFGYALFAFDVRGIQLLAALAFVRWLSLLLIRPGVQTK